MKKHVAIGLACLLYALAWGYLAHPHRTLLPEDLYATAGRLDLVPLLKYPATWIDSVFPGRSLGLPLLALFGNALSLFLVIELLLLLEAGTGFIVASGVIFALSTWPTTYVFAVSGAPLVAALVLATFYCFTRSFGEEGSSLAWFALSGLCCALQGLTALSALPLMALQIVGAYLLAAGWKHSTRWRLFFAYLAPVVIFFGGFVALRFDAIVRYASEKLHTAQFHEGLAGLGVIPRVPFGSYYFIGSYYSPLITIPAALAAALFAFIFLDLKRRRTIEERILFLICCIVFLHPLIVDVLPFSRIGSIHYPIFPLSLVLLALVGSLWWEITTRRTVFRVVFAGILLSTLAVNLRHDFQLVGTSRPVSAYLRRLGADASLHVLTNDLHADALESWLRVPLKRVDDPRAIVDSEAGRRALLIGPRGMGSGKGLYSTPELKDFYPQLVRPKEVTSLEFPFYGFLPPLLFEHEGASGFYFSGATPSPEQSPITVWIWES